MQLQKHILHICYSKAFQVDDPIVLVVMVVCTTCSVKHLLQVIWKLYITLPSFDLVPLTATVTEKTMAASKFQLQDVQDAAEHIHGKVPATPFEVCTTIEN